ncbi:hypothetical protein GCM10010299_43380 [Streptomyces tanashiensis]|nr:hypothetical protein GCM10010299_43380 [Streptomyces tanashiensis]
MSGPGSVPVPDVRLHQAAGVPSLGFQMEPGLRGVEPRGKGPLPAAAVAFQQVRQTSSRRSRYSGMPMPSQVLQLARTGPRTRWCSWPWSHTEALLDWYSRHR